MTEHFYSVLRELLDKHAPVKTRSVRLHPNSPWFTDSLRELKREKHRYERKFRSTNLEVHRQIYKHACQAYTNALNTAKTTYYKEKISGASNDQLFKMINGLFRMKAIPPLPSHESLPALADTFSGFYHFTIVKLRKKLEQSEFSTMDFSTVLHPGGGGGVLRISSDGDDRRIFWGLKFLIPGFFWAEKFGKHFFWSLDLTRDFLGYSKMCEDS